MNDIEISFVVTAIIFGIATIITFIAWIYHVWKGYDTIKHDIPCDEEKKFHQHHIHKIHWLRSVWIYACLFTSFFVFTMYYVTSALGAGMLPTSSSDVILWSRWLIVGMVGITNNILLAFILTHHVGDYDGNEVNSHGGLTPSLQSIFIIIWYIFAALSMFAATLSDVEGVKIARLIFSAISFAIHIFLYFFPFNKLMFIKDDHDDILFVQTHKHLSIKEKTNRHSIILFMRWTAIISIIFAFVLYYVIWILSASNGLTETLSILQEVISYEVADCISTIPPAILFILFDITFKQKTIQIKNLKERTMTFGDTNHHL